MTTERDYRYIVDDVYAVDSHKVKVPLKKGAVVAQGKFKIITAPVLTIPPTVCRLWQLLLWIKKGMWIIVM